MLKNFSRHKLLTVIKRHWLGIVVALLAAGHVLLPVVAGRLVAGPAFQGVYYSDNGDWLYYVARVRDLSEGHSGGSPYYAEHADDPNMSIPTAETVLALLVRALKIDPVHLQAVLDGILPFIATLLFYALLYSLSKSRWVATILPLGLLMLNIWNLDKAVHPQVNLPLVLIFLLAWFSLLSRLDRGEKLARLNTLVCGVMLGLLYLIYFYDWTFLYVVLGCSTLLALLDKKFDTCRLNILIVGISAPFALYYASLIQKVLQSPFYAETAVRFSTYASHLPQSLPKLMIALLACSIYYALTRYTLVEKTRVTRGVLALVMANVIYPNHQIITGRVFQTLEHWVLMPIMIFALATAFMYHLLKQHTSAENKRTASILGLSFLAIAVAVSIRLSTFMAPPVSQGSLETFAKVQRYAPVFHYLNQTTPANSVVLSDNPLLSYMLPAFTHNYIYYGQNLVFLPMSDREIMKRHILSNQLNPDFPRDKNFGLVKTWRAIWGGIFDVEQTHLFRWLGLKPINKYPFERELSYAEDTLRDLEPSGQLTFKHLLKYRLDYVIWDKQLHPHWAVDRFSQLKKIFEQDGLIVYHVEKADAI